MLKAIGLGAYDFYRKPVDIDELGLIVSRAFHVASIEAENRRLEQTGGGQVLGSIISSAPEMLKVAKTIERVASADVSVMLLGASGTRSEEHTSELQSLMRISYAVFCLKKKNTDNK